MKNYRNQEELWCLKNIFNKSKKEEIKGPEIGWLIGMSNYLQKSWILLLQWKKLMLMSLKEPIEQSTIYSPV